jgi:hypothetical protein
VSLQPSRQEFEFVSVGPNVLDGELVFVAWVVFADEQENPTTVRVRERVEHPI